MSGFECKAGMACLRRKCPLMACNCAELSAPVRQIVGPRLSEPRILGLAKLIQRANPIG